MISFVKNPPNLALCDNVMRFEVATTLPANTEGGVSIEVTVFDADDAILGADLLYPSLPGSASTNLSEYIRSMMYSLQQFTFPEQGNIPWNPKTGLIKEYKVKCQEMYADAPSPALTTIWLYYHYAVRGKIPYWKIQEFYAQYTSFSHWISSTKSFLTLSPKTLTTTPTMMQKLFLLIWWEPEATEKLNLKVNIGFTDGTTGSFVTTQQTGDLAQNTIIEFGVSYGLLGIESWVNTNHAGKKVAYYTVTAMYGEVVRSETRTYVMDYRSFVNAHLFIFANSVGGYDTLLARGVSELSSEFTYVNIFQFDFDTNLLQDRVQLSANSTDNHTCRTGYIDAPMADYLAEFFESFERYEVIGSKLVPVVLHDSKVIRRRDNENIFYAEFDYEHALNQVIEAEA